VAKSPHSRSSLEDKLFTVSRNPFKECHITLDAKLCGDCSSRICTRICPAEVYVWNERSDKVDIRHENCLECGTCRVACEMENIEWVNPPAGAGIIYRNS